ncbi:hypothetical protein C9374_000050 [Naegleria lovaniensis]|uniref:C2 domain-containing protein n=1 Tax=Naegleria lovaniensis TaxID=51637 RepID=A0AA88GZ21_NAELO|nr:uncharacterized protein C9374_000050 [Naegleria lovaniensis]KAG2388611.1 hypothetical protein C9374_000050 [Naegleria lovaniensis]
MMKSDTPFVDSTALYEQAKKRLRRKIPAAQAVTYTNVELPYHFPPEVYKVSFSEEFHTGILYSRVNNWSGSREELKTNDKALGRIKQNQVMKEQSSLSSSSVVSSSRIQQRENTPNESNDIHVQQETSNVTTNNIGDFLAYYYLKGHYPEVEWTIYRKQNENELLLSNNTNQEGVKSDSLDSRSNDHDILKHLFSKDQSTLLNKDANYIWVMDANFNFIFAPEHQVDFALQRVRVKHGDLTASGHVSLVGNIDTLTVGRLPARMGGEFRFDKSKGTWRIDNDSSYCFFREDNLIISNTAKIKWQLMAELLLRSFGIVTNDILWLDLVQSRRLDSFIVQKISKTFVRMRKEEEKETAMSDVSRKFALVNLFRGVNLLDIVFEAFGAKSFFCTSGKLLVEIVEALNLPHLDIFKLQHAHSYCKVGLRGCETIEHRNWWDKYYTTAIQKRNQNPQFNEKFTLYVTSMDVQILDLKVFHSKLGVMPILLGECELELSELNFDEFDELDLYLPLVVPKGVLSLHSLTSSSNSREEQDDPYDRMNVVPSSLVQVNSITAQHSGSGNIAFIGESLKQIAGTSNSSSSQHSRIGKVSVKPSVPVMSSLNFMPSTLTPNLSTTPLIHIKLKYVPHIKHDLQYAVQEDHSRVRTIVVKIIC